jgi:hypothetical protein
MFIIHHTNAGDEKFLTTECMHTVKRVSKYNVCIGEETMGMISDVKRLRTINLEFHLGKSQDETDRARGSDGKEKEMESWRKWMQ